MLAAILLGYLQNPSQIPFDLSTLRHHLNSLNSTSHGLFSSMQINLVVPDSKGQRIMKIVNQVPSPGLSFLMYVFHEVFFLFPKKVLWRVHFSILLSPLPQLLLLILI